MPETISKKKIRIFPFIINNWLSEIGMLKSKMEVAMREMLLIKHWKGKKVCLVAKLHIKLNILNLLFSICLWTRKFRIIQQLLFPFHCVSDDQIWSFTFNHMWHYAWRKPLTQSSVPENWVCLSVFWRKSTMLQMEIQVGCIYDKLS